jgi:hypothetical protein
VETPLDRAQPQLTQRCRSENALARQLLCMAREYTKKWQPIQRIRNPEPRSRKIGVLGGHLLLESPVWDGRHVPHALQQPAQDFRFLGHELRPHSFEQQLGIRREDHSV